LTEIFLAARERDAGTAGGFIVSKCKMVSKMNELKWEIGRRSAEVRKTVRCEVEVFSQFSHSTILVIQPTHWRGFDFFFSFFLTFQ
jgi:hypothetical protein